MSVRRETDERYETALTFMFLPINKNYNNNQFQTSLLPFAFSFLFFFSSANRETHASLSLTNFCFQLCQGIKPFKVTLLSNLLNFVFQNHFLKYLNILFILFLFLNQKYKVIITYHKLFVLSQKISHHNINSPTKPY